MMIGVLLRDTSQSQCNFSVINAVNIINQTTQECASLFSMVESVPCVRILACLTTIDKIYGYRGDLVATDVETARILLRHNSNVKHWYVWDLEWLRNRYLIDDMKYMYGSKRFIITCRSRSHAEALAEFTGLDVSEFKIENNFTKYLLERAKNETKM